MNDGKGGFVRQIALAEHGEYGAHGSEVSPRRADGFGSLSRSVDACRNERLVLELRPVE